jgi:hypothetical protein
VNWCVHSNSAVLVPTQIGATLSMWGDSPRPILPHPAPVLLEGGPEQGMNMSTARDSAVGNFVERLQRSASAGNAAVVPGWLELRKGVHSTS